MSLLLGPLGVQVFLVGRVQRAHGLAVWGASSALQKSGLNIYVLRLRLHKRWMFGLG